jgi:hypothetical protein
MYTSRYLGTVHTYCIAVQSRRAISTQRCLHLKCVRRRRGSARATRCFLTSCVEPTTLLQSPSPPLLHLSPDNGYRHMRRVSL